MAGLVPAIHVSAEKDVNARAKRGHGEAEGNGTPLPDGLPSTLFCVI
jgi:hypothetical protein